MIALAVIGCGSHPWVDLVSCDDEVVVVAADVVTPLGFSALDAVGWYGDADAIAVEWSGRHSRTPPSDTIDVTIGGLTGDVQLRVFTPARADVPERECAALDRLEFTRDADFTTVDGGVSGPGTMGFSLAALALDDAAQIDGVAPEVALDEARWLEVDRALDGDLAPPERISLYVNRWSTFESAQIVADGPNYGVAVWRCDEQHAPGCITWR